MERQVYAQSTGLTSAEATSRLAADGRNLLSGAPPARPLRELASQLTHLLALLLWLAAGLALLAGMVPLAVAIVVVVILNALFAFWQEHRADRSTERLRTLLPSVCRVRRDGRPMTVESTELVRGDLVVLGPGDRIAADLRVDESHDLRVDESLATGESVAVARDEGDPLLAGTFVVQGEAEAVVVATGSQTTLAGLSALARSAQRPPSPLTVQLASVVRVVAVLAAVTGVLLGAGGLAMGLSPTDAFLFGVGVAVALVPEGMLPTVTLSLARGAQLMAGRQALVRRLDAVETLGATTFICTDKTGTLTQNRMSVVEVWTPEGTVTIEGSGYDPEATLTGPPGAVAALSRLARTAVVCVSGRAVERSGRWVAEGDPMDAAVHCLARRVGLADPARTDEVRRPFTADRMLTSVVREGAVNVLGAPEQVMSRGGTQPAAAIAALHEMTGRGRRVLAVARRSWRGETQDVEVEARLELLGLIGIEDPPRPDVADALHRCRAAGIRVAMVTGDHPRTAEAIAREVHLIEPGGVVLDGATLPEDDAELADVLDTPHGAVVARVAPADKLRIAVALRSRGHVVAMTGDGVNDAPALRAADVGVAMGASGSDVARETADLVLLDDHFGTIVTAVELGRATFRNVRRFLTYHLTDNVAELAPFAVWAMTGGDFPLAIGVLQVLALDIGTDMLPALALGAEPPSARILSGSHRSSRIVDRALLVRALGVLGPVEAAASLAAFAVVLLAGGWAWGEVPGDQLLAVASGTAFAAIAAGQLANAFACRSETAPIWRIPLLSNPLVLVAVGMELILLVLFLGLPPLAGLLGGSWPSTLGWVLAGGAAVTIVIVDAAYKGALDGRRARPRR